jgi:hypothetical protein
MKRFFKFYNFSGNSNILYTRLTRSFRVFVRCYNHCLVIIVGLRRGRVRRNVCLIKLIGILCYMISSPYLQLSYPTHLILSYPILSYFILSYLIVYSPYHCHLLTTYFDVDFLLFIHSVFPSHYIHTLDSPIKSLLYHSHFLPLLSLSPSLSPSLSCNGTHDLLLKATIQPASR